jgi:hypothetical protein
MSVASRAKRSQSSGERSFSVAQVVITALVGFTISGLGGAAVNEYFSRAKPQLILEAMGLQAINSERGIKISESLEAATESSAWIESLKGVKSVKELYDELRRARDISNVLILAQSVAETWLKKIEARGLKEKTVQLDSEDLRATPYFDSEALLASLKGDARRKSLPEPPIGLSELRQEHQVLPSVIENGELWVISESARANLGKESDAGSVLLSESLARGDIRNLTFYARHFIQSTAEENQKLALIQNELATAIASEFSFAVRATVVNTGRTAITLGPAFAIEVSSSTSSRSLPLVALPSVTVSDRLFGSLDDFMSPPQEASASQVFVTIRPNESQALTLTSLRRLTFSDPTIEGLLKCKDYCVARIAATRTSGGLIISPPIRIDQASIESDRLRALGAFK